MNKLRVWPSDSIGSRFRLRNNRTEERVSYEFNSESLGCLAQLVIRSAWAAFGATVKRALNIRGVLETLPALMTKYRTAVLEAACTGHLVPTEAELARKQRRDFEPAAHDMIDS